MEREDSSSNAGQSLIPVMSYAVMSVPHPVGSLRLCCLMSRLHPEEGTEILQGTFQGLGYKIKILEHTLCCT